ncbi:hypothetical protein [Wolbachia endosymbiont of Pentidionis agamae]|uniref:hypothetical protein n=1 Tax=Wolbachia endosymbiont of Pentidionis agamae TaxID=3110435 RepID=UPI002FD4F013
MVASLQKIIIGQLEKNLGQPFLHKLAVDKEYFREVKKYVEAGCSSLANFLNMHYVVNNSEDVINQALYLALESDNKEMMCVLKKCGANVDNFIKENYDKSEEYKRRIEQNFDEIATIITNYKDSISLVGHANVLLGLFNVYFYLFICPDYSSISTTDSTTHRVMLGAIVAASYVCCVGVYIMMKSFSDNDEKLF